MSSVDDRIVNMQFNNKQFTDGVTQTQKSLAGLDRTLAGAAKTKGLTTMANGVDTVKTKFSALQVAGVAAIATIASKATAAGLNLVKSLTLAPVMDGFKEYQTNLESIQTIMSNTGKNVETVNRYLDKLNEYSDKTIYNFSEMAKNIGTFTAAGVDLKTATASIKGIANLAALSGSNSQQASTAMYQLSQAISAGKVGLQDWNSVVNAGMGGKVFQTALSRTAQNMGLISEGAIKLEGPMKKLTINGQSFRESIMAKPGQESWLTGEALVDTLKQISGGYSDAQLKAKGFTQSQIKEIQKLARTGFDAATTIKTLPQLMGVIRESIGSTWAAAFRTILGDFKQSKKLWTAVGDAIIGPGGIITNIQDRFLKVLDRWADLGGRDSFLEAFKNIFTALGRVVGAFTGAWSDIFGTGPTGKDLYTLTEAFRRFTDALIPSKKTTEDLRTVFAGFFSVLHIGWAVLKGIAGAVGAFVGAIFGGSGDIRSAVMSLAAWLSEGRILLDQWITQGGALTDFLAGIGETAGKFVKPIIDGIGLIVKAFSNLASGQGLEGFMDPINDLIAGVADWGGKAAFGLQTLFAPFEGISQFFYDLSVDIQSFSSSFDGFSIPIGWVDTLKEKIEGLNPFPALLEKFGGSADSGMSTAASGFEKVSGAAASFRDDVGGSVDSVKNKIGEAADTVKQKMGEAFGAMSGGGSAAAGAGTTALASAAEGSMTLLSKLGDLLAKVGPAIKAVFQGIGDAASWVAEKFMAIFGSYDAIEWAAVVNALFSGALILTLRNFVKGFADIGPAIQDTFGQLTSTLKAMQQQVKAKMIMVIAVAVGVLVAALVALSFIEVPALQKALGAIGILLGGMIATLYALSKVSAGFNVAALAASMVLISAAMLGLAMAIVILGKQDIETLKKGLGALAIVMGILVTSMFAFSLMKGSIEGMAASMLVLGIAMNVLAAAVAIFGNMDMDTLQQGLTGMAVALGIMVAALLGLSLMKGSIEGAAGSILIMAAAMVIMSVAIAAFGNMDLSTLAIGLGAVAITLGLFVASLLLLSGVGPSALIAAGAILILATSLAVLVPVILTLGATPWEVIARGIGFMAAALAVLLLAGAGAALVAPGLAILAVAVLSLGAAMLMAGAGMLLFGTGFAIFAAAGVAGVAVLMVAFNAFIALLPTIAVQLAASLVAFLKAIAAASPKIRKAMGEILRNMIGTVRDAIPEFRKLLQDLIDNGIRVLSDSVPQFIELGFRIIDEFLKSAKKHVPSIADSAMALATKFLNVLGNRMPDFVDAGADLIIKTINAIADTIDEKRDELGAAGLNLARAVLDGITGGLFSEARGKISAAVDYVAGLIPNGLKKLWEINSPSRVMFRIALGIGEGIAKGIKASTYQAVEAAVIMANTIASSVDGVVSGTVASAQQDFVKKRGEASFAQAGADIRNRGANAAQKRADALAKKANKIDKKNKEKKKAAEKKAKRAQTKANQERRKADKQQENATKLQAAADAAGQRVQDERAFVSADNLGKAQMRDDLAMDLAAQSQAALARANAEAAEADALRKKNKKQSEEMRKKAKASADEAARLAGEAQRAQAEALHYYQQARAEATAAVMDRIRDIREQQAADEAARKWEEEYNAASTERKRDMMSAKAAENQAKADAASAAAANALAQAEQIAGADPEAANKLVDYAEEQARIASQAANEASQNREQLQQLIQQLEQDAASGGGGAGTGGSAGGGGTVIAPSRTALEDAAKAFDRYTTSMRDAEELASATAGTVQYVQNNYSPKALTPSEIYRQSKNLLSATEVKMGANT